MKLLRYVLLVLGFPTVLYAHDYFPWGADDYAVYLESRHQTEQKSTVQRAVEDWRYVTNFAGFGDQWVYAGETRGIYIYRDGEYYQLPDDTFEVGESTQVNFGGCNEDVTVTLLSKNQTMLRDAARFENVITLQVSDHPCSDAGVRSLNLAKGVGVIDWRELSLDGSISYELSEGMINRVEYPVVPDDMGGIVLSAKLPGPVIKLTDDLALPVSMKVTNVSENDVNVTFFSWEAWNISLTDENGEHVQQAPSEFVGSAVVEDTVLPAGQSYEMNRRFVAADPLEPGTYTIEVRMNALPRYEISGTIILK